MVPACRRDQVAEARWGLVLLLRQEGRFAEARRWFVEGVGASRDMVVTLQELYKLDYDPVPALQKTKCPVLALNGEKDLQVPSKQNLAKIERTLRDAGNKDFQTTELLDLNHLFQHAPTGSPTEYGSIQETMAPEALNAVSDWVLKHTAPEEAVSAPH